MKKISVIILAVMIMTQNICNASTFTDIEDHWAEEAITKWSASELVVGYDGKFNPDAAITRGELAVVLERLFKYKILSKETFEDLENTWYTEALLKSNEKGIILGSGGKVRPKDPATREEAVVMLSRAFNIEEVKSSTTFTDQKEISEWALGYITAMSQQGYIHGKPDGGFHPKDNITRAECIKLIDNLIGAYYDKNGTYSDEDIKGYVVVNHSDVILKDMKIDGDVIVAEGVGEGDFTMNTVSINGQLNIYGGGEHSIKIYNTPISKVVLGKATSAVRIVSDGIIEEVVVEKATMAIIDGNVKVKHVTINDKSDVKIRENVKVTTLNVEGKDVKAVFDGNIKNLNVKKEAATSSFEGKGKVTSYNGGKESIAVDAVSSATVTEKSDVDTPSPSPSPSPNPSPSPSPLPNPSPSPSTPTSSVYTYSVKNDFIGAPTVCITINKGKTTYKNYIVYVDGHKVGEDKDGDGVVVTLGTYFNESSKVEFLPLGKKTRIKVAKKMNK